MTRRPAWSLLETAAEAVPRSLATLHRSLTPGDEVDIMAGPIPDLDDLILGAGLDTIGDRPSGATATVRVRRCWTLPDTIGPRPAMLVCGLNPSPAAADAGIGFARPGNRFWPAALAAGIVSRDRDPDHALDRHGIAMTDLVKRTTVRADEVTVEEYRAGLGRIERLSARVEPSVVCFVGLAGWRVAVDRNATAGPQDRRLGGAPVYLMPSTSGLNADSRLDDLTAHLRAAAVLGGQ